MRGATEAVRFARHEVAHPANGAALAEARRQNPGESDLAGWCLLAVRTWLGVPARYKSAIAAWRATPEDQRHKRGVPPEGVPVFWAIGPHGHVALSAGRGRCYSTDIKRRGRADLVPIDLVGDRWGAQYLGWAETLNRVRVHTPKPKPATKPKPRGKVVEVKRGDTLATLAGPDWANVWHHDANRDLRGLRRRPELIRPGDRLWIR